MDSAHCKMPDYYIYKAPTCACGDDPVRIPLERRTEGIAQKAHWCSGTLQMADGFGNPRYVYNPHTYDELRGMMASKIDPYLECISMHGQLEPSSFSEQEARCDEIKPSVAVLDAQQVSPIAVLERCKSNYQQKQWDVGAWMLYDPDRLLEVFSGGTTLAVATQSRDDPVGRCLLSAERNRESNLECMSDYLGQNYWKESSSEVFWRYEKVHHVLHDISSDDVDACIVFSGPAKKNDTSPTTLEFRRCSHDYTDTGCVIPHMVWSSSSKNKVPVATLHTVEEVTPEDREEVANALFEEARDMAMKALRKLEDFTDPNLEVVLFSGEGDALHQIFDCIVMGPLARVDFWDRCVPCFLSAS